MATKILWHPQRFLNTLNITLDRKLQLTGEIVKKNAQAGCPVKSGNLRNSIELDVDEKKKTVYVGSDLPYALFVEMGTRHNAPVGFLRKAIAKSKNAIQQIFSKH